MESYHKLTGQQRFIGVQPVTLDKNTYNKNANYYLTYKVDGKRHLLLITANASYLITSKMEFKKVKLPKKVYTLAPNTILDMELFDKKYYIFDILYFKSVDVRNIPLLERIEIINDIIPKIKSKKIIIKPYWSPYAVSVKDNFIELKTLYRAEIKNGGVDGIIFTPDSGYNSKVLKWKPIELLSIDFKIKKLPDNNIALLLQNGNVFAPRGYPDVGTVKISKEKYSEFKDGDIVEFIFKNNKFIPLRTRPDKIKSNHISVILSNFKEITHPTDVLKLLQG